jgi:hypothetical protein
LSVHDPASAHSYDCFQQTSLARVHSYSSASGTVCVTFSAAACEHGRSFVRRTWQKRRCAPLMITTCFFAHAEHRALYPVAHTHTHTFTFTKTSHQRALHGSLSACACTPLERGMRGNLKRVMGAHFRWRLAARPTASPLQPRFLHRTERLGWRLAEAEGAGLEDCIGDRRVVAT